MIAVTEARSLEEQEVDDDDEIDDEEEIDEDYV